MEFLKQSYISTITSITYDSGTLTVSNIINRDVRKQYVSSGYADDSLTSSLVFDFGSTLPVDRIGLISHNLKEFNVFYDGVTANSIGLTSTGDTTTLSYINESESSKYFKFASTISCQTITLDMKKTQVANSEKAVGYMTFSQVNLDFARIPSAKNYSPVLDPKRVEHRMSDGGVRIHFLANKYKTKVKFKYISRTFKDSLRDIYEDLSPFIYTPFGTTTGWDGIHYEALWTGKFDFEKYSDNAQDSGYSGAMVISET